MPAQNTSTQSGSKAKGDNEVGNPPVNFISIKKDDILDAEVPHDEIKSEENVNDTPPVNDDRDSPPDEPSTSSNEKPKLSKSIRLKGYFGLCLLSIINFYAALVSQRGSRNSKPPTDSQRNYAMASSGISAVICFLVTIMHFDRFTRFSKGWKNFFKANSLGELCLIIFLSIWWTIATWINTTIDGAAGEGKNQWNLYFSTWLCLGTSVWIAEQWRTAAGQNSAFVFLTGAAPPRISSWIEVLLTGFLTMIFSWYTRGHIDESHPMIAQQMNSSPAQWIILIVMSTVSLFVALGFLLSAIFGENMVPKDCETITEGVLLLVMTLCWIPIVAATTTPGGVTALIGNLYFSVWATTFSVVRTFCIWIRDWRSSIHRCTETQILEYERSKRAAIRQLPAKTENAQVNNKKENHNVENDMVVSVEGD